MSKSIDTVQGIYAAFGRGDIPAILAALAPNVRWEEWVDQSAQRAGVPWLRAIEGRDNVAAFFGELAKMEFHGFKVDDVFGDERKVVAQVSVDVSVKATGRRFRDEEIHLWVFDEQGRVKSFRHYNDTAKHIRAAGLALPD